MKDVINPAAKATGGMGYFNRRHLSFDRSR
jgi:hypothetical protein